MKPPDTHDSSADRAIDTLLEEALGRVRAPDLSARIEAELRGAVPFAILRESAGDVQRSGVLTPRRALAAAALIGFALGVVIPALRGPSLRVPVRVALTNGDASLATHTQGDLSLVVDIPRDVRLAVGDRIQTLRGAALRLEPFGALSLEPSTIVEIESMQWTQRDGILVVGALGIGAIAGAFTWSALDGGVEQRVEAGSSNTLASGDVDVARLRADLEAMREEVRSLEAANAQLKEATLRTPVAKAPEVAVDPDPSVPPTTPELDIEVLAAGGFDDVLGKIDWALVGTTSRDMLPLLTKLAEALKAGEDLPLGVLAEIQRLNANLIEQAQIVQQGDVEGAGINGSYTHPAVAGNQILATLAAAGLGLNEAQRGHLQELMNLYSTRDRDVRIDAGTHEFALQTLMAEIDYKAEFYDRVQGLLSADQARVMTNDLIGDRIRIGLHGPSIVLTQFAEPVPVEGPEQLSQHWNNQIQQNLGLDAAQTERAREIVSQWTASLPPDFWTNRGDELEQHGMLRTERIRNAARLQLDLMQRLLSTFGDSLSERARRELREQRGIMVPVPR